MKTFFFELCVVFSRFSSSYGIPIMEYLGSVYEESDFSQTDYQWVGIRKGDSEVGLRNLGCTCYINSLFQVLYNNENIRKAIMESSPEADSQEHQVLSTIKKSFWELKHTIMDCVVLDKFCKVFTAFDGMPINVRVQQDANEFFSLLIDILQRELKDSYSKSLNQKEEKETEQVLEHYKDPLNEEYGGIIVNRI